MRAYSFKNASCEYFTMHIHHTAITLPFNKPSYDHKKPKLSLKFNPINCPALAYV